MAHGKSVSQENVNGIRRTALGADGLIHVLAPKHFRKIGRHYMEQVSDEEIAGFYFNIDLSSLKKIVSGAKDAFVKSEAEFEKQIVIAKETGIVLTDEEVKKIKDDITGVAKQNLSDKEIDLANAEGIVSAFKKTA